MAANVVYALVMVVFFNDGNPPNSSEIQVKSLKECFDKAATALESPPTAPNIEGVAAGCVIKFVTPS